MAPRANWKGYMRLSLVSCPVALFPAATTVAKISFNTLNRETGHKVKRLLVEPDTGKEVPADQQVKGYPVGRNAYIRIEDHEIEEIRLETSKTIELEKFVPRSEIDSRYMDTPYYIAPDGMVGIDAFAVLRDAMRDADMVAIGRVVLQRRERIMMIEPWEKGLLATVLRFANEVRSTTAYFEDIPDVEVDDEARNLAEVIMRRKSGNFDPQEFEDRFEKALVDLIKHKEAGMPLPSFVIDEPARNVINLMDALKRSVEKEGKPALDARRKGPVPTTKVASPRTRKSRQG